ncbi:HAMP domain-containing histidine kinase [Patescibacteria group bacterium]|nr:HAMP domain-containing histidine kinase [Patescibacteria group bacterium]
MDVIKNFWPHHNKFFGLRNKFRIIVSLFLIVIFSVVTIVLVNNNSSSLTQRVTDQAKAYADLSNKPLADAYDLYFNSGYLEFKDSFTNILNLDKNVTRIQILDTSNNILFDSEDLNQLTPPSKKTITEDYVLTAIKQTEPTYIYAENGQHIQQIIYPTYDNWGGRRYTIRYFVSYDEVLRSATVISYIIISIAATFLLLSFFSISLLVNKVIINPIEKVAKGATLISSGVFDHSISVNTHDEVEDLATAVNKMAQTLHKDITSLQEVDKLKDEFIAIASHNLRTPLTIIKGYLSFFKNGQTGELSTEQFRYVNLVSENVNQLDSLVEDLLSVVYFESGNTSLIKKPTNLLDIAEEAMRLYQQAAVDKTVLLVLQPPIRPIPIINLDQTRISQVMKNLLDNAIKFSRPGSEVSIAIEVGLNDVIVHVSDQGVGISPEEIQKLFQKFHRATSILNYSYIGEGISLYISKLIISAHNGKIWVTSELNKGSVFSFSLPIHSSIPDTPFTHTPKVLARQPDIRRRF